jgi:RNA polymerase sigma-70 factor, ECF subfamily
MSCLAVSTHAPLAPARFDDDARLVAGMIADSPEAWRTFHARYGGLVARSIQGITRRFWRIATFEDAQDIAGVFYLSLVARDKKKLRSFDPARGYRLVSWLRVLVMNATYDYLRRAGREPRKEELALAEELPSDAPDPFARIARDQTVTAVSRELERFSARDRAFTKLHLVEGADASEVAARMRVSVKTVYSKKNKIVTRLSLALAGTD